MTTSTPPQSDSPAEQALPHDPSGTPPEHLSAPPVAQDRYGLEVTEEDAPFTPLNWALIASGIVAMIGGFFLLSQVDARATNWQSIWAPMLILGAYVVIFLGILIVRRPVGQDSDTKSGDE